MSAVETIRADVMTMLAAIADNGHTDPWEISVS